MSYFMIAVAIGLVGLLFWSTSYVYFKKNPDKFDGLNALVAIIVLGPLLPLIHSSLAKRNYGITKRELWGLLMVLALFVAAIAISLVFGVGVRGR